MRCDQCNKFAAYDDSTEPEVDLNFDADTGDVNAQVRIVLTHDECGQELKEASFDFDETVPKEILVKHAGVDRLAALNSAIAMVRRGGSISLSGVYGGAADPIDMMTLFDKKIQLRMGQANVKRWIPDIMPLLTDDDPLGVEQFATHRLPLDADRADAGGRVRGLGAFAAVRPGGGRADRECRTAAALHAGRSRRGANHNSSRRYRR